MNFYIFFDWFFFSYKKRSNLKVLSEFNKGIYFGCQSICDWVLIWFGWRYHSQPGPFRSVGFYNFRNRIINWNKPYPKKLLFCDFNRFANWNPLENIVWIEMHLKIPRYPEYWLKDFTIDLMSQGLAKHSICKHAVFAFIQLIAYCDVGGI